MNTQDIINILIEQRNTALNELVAVKAALLEANRSIAENSKDSLGTSMDGNTKIPNPIGEPTL